MKIVNAALYVRVSTQEQAKEGYSIGEQIDRLTKYCEAMRWSVYKTYTDPGYSGANTNRPGLQSMLTDIKAGKIDKVVVYKLDRLSRSQKDTLNLIEDEFLKNNTDFISLNENFDTSSAFGRAMVGILAVFAQLEREQIKERMHMGMEARAKTGKWCGAKAPTGYEFKDDQLIVIPYEAMQVKAAFESLAAGHSINNTVNAFKAKGYTTQYGQWSNDRMLWILRNKIYAGLVKYGDNYYPGIHEPLVSEELFNTVQAELDRRSKLHNTNHNPGKATSYLGGYIYCCRCGAKYIKISNSTANRNKTKRYPQRYYECASRASKNKNATKDPNCRNKIYRMSDLDNIVFDQIRQLKLEPHTEPEVEVKDNRAELIRAELTKVDKQLSKLMDMYLMDDLPKDILSDKLTELNTVKENLTSELEKLATAKPTLIQIKDTIDSFDQVLSSGDFDSIRAVISQLIERIDIDGEDITITWTF